MHIALKTAILAFAILGLSGCAILSKPPIGNLMVPQPAKVVEIDRYLGRWYELYRYNARFQKDCEAVSADYTLNADGSIRVWNTCHQGAVDGPVRTATGRAKVVDASSGAKLKVSFFGPFYGDYWVLDRSDDYQWSIVGEPSGRYLWVLSRDPKPSADLKAELRRRVEQLGYDGALMRETLQ